MKTRNGGACKRSGYAREGEGLRWDWERRGHGHGSVSLVVEAKKGAVHGYATSHHSRSPGEKKRRARIHRGQKHQTGA
jgi:hypothetical protein